MARGHILTTWDVACIKCGARPNERCRNRYGDRQKFHIARIRLAAHARREDAQLRSDLLAKIRELGLINFEQYFRSDRAWSTTQLSDLLSSLTQVSQARQAAGSDTP